MDAFMQMAVSQVLEELDESMSKFDRAIDNAAATYAVDPSELVQAVSREISDHGSESVFRTV